MEYVIMIQDFYTRCLSSHLEYCNPGTIFFYARFLSSHLEYVIMIYDMIFCTLGAYWVLIDFWVVLWTSLSSSSKGLVKLTNGHIIVMSPMSLWRKTFGLEEGQRRKRVYFLAWKVQRKGGNFRIRNIFSQAEFFTIKLSSSSTLHSPPLILSQSIFAPELKKFSNFCRRRRESLWCGPGKEDQVTVSVGVIGNNFVNHEWVSSSDDWQVRDSIWNTV